MEVFRAGGSGYCRSLLYKIGAILLCVSVLIGTIIPVIAANPEDSTNISIDTTITGTPSGTYNEKDVFWVTLPQGSESFTLTTSSGMAATTADDGTGGDKQNISISKGDSNYNAAKAYYEVSKTKITGADTSDGDCLLFRISVFDISTFSVVIKGYIVVSLTVIPENASISMDSVMSGTSPGSYNEKNVFQVFISKETNSFSLTTTSGMAATTADDGTGGDKQNISISRGDSNYNAAKAYP